MARPKHDPDAVPTRQRILSAAALAFSSDGFAAANLRDIAAEVGIRRPSLLYHFDSKEQLYAAVVDQTLGDLAAALALPMEIEGSFEERLEDLTRRFVAFLDDHPDAAGIVVRELLTTDGPGLQVLVTRGGDLLTQVEAWVREKGGTRVRDVNVRRALLQVVSEAMLRNASSAATAALWGESSADDAWNLARAMLLKDEVER